MKRKLLNLERKVINRKAGWSDLEILVCAINPLKKGNNIDQIEICTNYNMQRDIEEILKSKYPDDEIRVLVTKTKRKK